MHLFIFIRFIYIFTFRYTYICVGFCMCIFKTFFIYTHIQIFDADPQYLYINVYMLYT